MARPGFEPTTSRSRSGCSTTEPAGPVALAHNSLAHNSVNGVNLPERVSMDTVCNSSVIKLLDICHSTDLRIVNGRIGSDAGIGHSTYMSPTGESLIDYAIMSQDIFHILH